MAGYYNHNHEHAGPKLFTPNNVRKSKEIGHGVFSKVYEGTLCNNGVTRKVAIKILKNQERLVQEAYSEINILQHLNHDNVIQLFGIVEIAASSKPPWLIFDLAKGGNLLQLVKTQDLEDEVLINYCRDVASGMTYLHSQQVLHKDLVVRNVLIDGNIAKVADFGISSLVADEEDNDEYYKLAPGHSRGNVQKGRWGSVRSSAIENYTEGIFVKSTDVWAFGVLLWEVWSGGEMPYHNNKEKARNLIISGMSPLDISRPYKCPTEVLTLMKTIFQQKRQLGPEFYEVLRTLDEIRQQYMEPEEYYYPRHVALTTVKTKKEPESSSSGLGWLLAGTAVVTGLLAAATWLGDNPRRNNNVSDEED